MPVRRAGLRPLPAIGMGFAGLLAVLLACGPMSPLPKEQDRRGAQIGAAPASAEVDPAPLIEDQEGPAEQPPQVPQQPPPNATHPFTGWAAQELARRGFVRDRSRFLVAIDAGHGGTEVGSAYAGLGEKTVNLGIGLKLQDLLEADGVQTVMTREDEGRAYTLPDDGTNPRSQYRADLQARIDLANAAGADIFVSVHNNGSANRAEAGTEVWYAPDRPFGDKNWALATQVLEAVIAELQAAGYETPNRGLKNGSTFRTFGDRTVPLFVLGNPWQGTRATQMPGILGETLFLSNPYEGWLLTNDYILDAIARGYRAGIQRYFAGP